MLSLSETLRFSHAFFAVAIVFPLIGISTYYALLTRQRRLATAKKEKTKIPPVSGLEHVKIGRILAAGVVILSLYGLVHPTVKYFLNEQPVSEAPAQAIIIGLLYVATLTSLTLLLRAKKALWRGIFATMTGMALVLVGLQDFLLGRDGGGAIFERTFEWHLSHFYYGLTASILMLFSVAIQPDIYKSKRWRIAHIALNCFALILFISLAATGIRDIRDISFYSNPG